MDTIPNGHHSEWTPFRMDTIPNGYHTELTPFRMDMIPNGHHSVWTLSRMHNPDSALTFRQLLRCFIGIARQKLFNKDDDLNKT